MAAGEAIAMIETLPALEAPEAWCASLEQAGAVFEAGAVVSYVDAVAELAEARAAGVLADLSHFGLICVEGPEAQKFLGSLFTGEVKQVTPGQGQFTSWCDGKGRMLATFWLFIRGDAYYLLLPKTQMATTVARLKQFLLRTKAGISDASANLVRLGLSGAELGERLASILGAALPVVRGETVELGGCTFLSLPAAGQPRWLALGPADLMQALWGDTVKSARPVGKAAWDLLDILAGVPMLLPETSGEFIPQMLDLEALGGLSFKKGCYPGQEVVARLQYRGQLKRRMYSASVAADSPPEPGTKLYGTGTSESVGMVLSAATQEPGRSAVLAVVVIEQRTAGGAIRVGSPEGPALEFADVEPLAGA
ncbi:CAF17-like 4Fe-4S cluster assembly/insertion protein YgfZ [Methyloterricola oryzae]|uniref:CAF17-like 4Fe-4S cluster assembly/insertion protein YgfZ n=1 Tax=Methyloterricola oryzae TaxID=1495050 RepID=UPI00069C4EE8|nr:folate-binding protein YgfZ [Methyloterricola oryzae]